MIVAQAWHADRCVTVCQALNIDVVGLRLWTTFLKMTSEMGEKSDKLDYQREF